MISSETALVRVKLKCDKCGVEVNSPATVPIDGISGQLRYLRSLVATWGWHYGPPNNTNEDFCPACAGKGAVE